jgi:hypothetical protein
MNALMATNQPRGTPGLLLLAFAVILLAISLVRWLQFWRH